MLEKRFSTDALEFVSILISWFLYSPHGDKAQLKPE